ncbi:hypothetical protein [Mammaliicoccus sciuri]|uniref:hypothetical protein n=1 Tax=Mammaliicoccus sciuri TaxID=1296 RepID=UPI0019527E5D|nr:hypothetical protein [Mammaliicoccus sciuri]MEB7816746.1 hypothetical protein [Mammaliicoccus sciuri]
MDILNNYDILIPILSAIVSGTLSYLAANIIHSYNKKYNKKEKAIDLANEFSKLITETTFDAGEINKQVYKEIGIDKKIKSLEDKKILHFDKHELQEYFTEEEINKYIRFKTIGNVKFVKLLSKSYKTESDYDLCLSKIILSFDSNKTIKENLRGNSWNYNIKGNDILLNEKDVERGIIDIYKTHFKLELHALNKLEWFSMSFVNNIAEEKVVYQSLHQVFLSMCLSEYINISLKNEIGHEKFYINLINQYNIWNKHKQKEIKRVNKRNYKNRNGYTVPKKLR